MGVKKLIYVRSNLELGVGDRVAVDRTRLANEPLRFRASTFRPCWTRLVNTWCVAGHAPEVLVSGGVMFDELSHVRFDAALMTVGMGRLVIFIQGVIGH